MARGTKPPAWALALAASVATAPTKKTNKQVSPKPSKRVSTKPTKKVSTKPTKKVSTKPTKKVSKKPATAAPGLLARVLTRASTLPKTDPVWLVCERRLLDLIDEVRGDTTALAVVLGVDRRSAQRLRAAYGIERRLVDGKWQ